MSSANDDDAPPTVDQQIATGFGDALSAVTTSLEARRQDDEQQAQAFSSPAQQRLADDEARHLTLMRDREASHAEISKLRDMLTVEHANLSDIEAEDASVLASIGSLRSKGVELPKGE